MYSTKFNRGLSLEGNSEYGDRMITRGKGKRILEVRGKGVWEVKRKQTLGEKFPRFPIHHNEK